MRASTNNWPWPSNLDLAEVLRAAFPLAKIGNQSHSCQIINGTTMYALVSAYFPCFFMRSSLNRLKVVNDLDSIRKPSNHWLEAPTVS